MGHSNKIILLAVASLLLAGCQQDKEDLTVFVADVKAKQKADIEPMPVMKAYEKFAYSAAELRDPFVSTVIDINVPLEEEIKIVVDNGIHPDHTRLKEVLEAYALDELRLVGTLEKEDIWALVQAPEGVIHKVRAGDYIGQNNGQILSVSDSGLALKEIVSDGDGGYVERDSSLSVIDVN